MLLAFLGMVVVIRWGWDWGLRMFCRGVREMVSGMDGWLDGDEGGGGFQWGEGDGGFVRFGVMGIFGVIGVLVYGGRKG